MELTILIFLSSGLFLGWSLGANDAANVFGTAVGTRMVRFRTAALICAVFVILGAVIDGAGAAHTLGKLGAVNALGGSFVAALAAALTVYWMTKLSLPVSTSQAIVGAIIGWNIFSGSITDMGALTKIMGTWVACPILSGLIAVPLFKLTEFVLSRSNIHLLRLDAYTRVGLIVAGAFGSYALGANNIANVMGVFVPASPFTDVDIFNGHTFTGIQQLFLLGAVAIAVGVYTYSKRVMLTVGGGLLSMSSVAAWVVVVSHSIVLFLFASEGLEHFLATHGLPTIPLVPVSSSQAVVGAVIGIGLYKGGKGIKWQVLGRISTGWVTTPVIAALISFIALFFVQNVFNQQVYREIDYKLTPQAVAKLQTKDVPTDLIKDFTKKTYKNAVSLQKALRVNLHISKKQEAKILKYSELTKLSVDEDKIAKIDSEWMPEGRIEALRKLKGKQYQHKWMLADDLASLSPMWKLLPETKANKRDNKELKTELAFIYHHFAVVEEE